MMEKPTAVSQAPATILESPPNFCGRREKTGMFYFYVRKIPPLVDAAEENKSPKNRCLFESFIDIEGVQWNIHVEECVAKGS